HGVESRLINSKLQSSLLRKDVVSGENYGRSVPNWEWAYEGSKNETFRVLELELDGDNVMVLLSGFAGLYTKNMISLLNDLNSFRLRGLLSILADYYEKKLCRNINAQNSWLYVSGIAFNVVATVIQDFDAVARDPSMVLIHHNNHES
ncbi:hypothetical protein HID58_042364, partial [Brassica napus]